MLETVLLAVAGANLGFMAAWLTIGALENLFHPFLNETYTAQVMDMERMREDYPEAYAHVAYRRLTNPIIRKRLFVFIVTWEVVATLCLWAATVATWLATFGALEAQPAISLGLVAALLFSSVWAGFLVAGNYFCYWFGHEGGQNTHFQMLFWGLANTILLMIVAMALVD